AAESAGALEEHRIAAAFLMGTVVADEQHERPAIDAALTEQIHEAADIAVHARDHRRERRMRLGLRTIPERRALGTCAGRRAVSGRIGERPLGELATERLYRVVRDPELGVRHGVIE